MLYIFHVDKGTLMTFDMQLSVAYVDKLKEEIERTCFIPASKQVLLMSGGQCLENHARVCSFGTGTDTNPVYLFSREIVESPTPPTPVIDYAPDIDLKEQVDTSLNMPATYNTVVARAHLAQKFYELAREQTRICERLVHDQHRQQQGWAAVVANLEDIITDFKCRSQSFLKIHQSQLDNREKYRKQLGSFNENLTLLSKIPVMPALLVNMKDSSDAPTLTELTSEEEGVGSNSTSESTNSECSDEEGEQNLPRNKVISLLHWVSQKDNHLSLEQVANDCTRLLNELNLQSIELWQKEMKEAIAFNDRADMKEIKGLCERLFRLDELLSEARRIVQEQSELAHAFLQNQNRASNLGDASILPDLCASHRRQLLVMLQNHQQLRDIRKRCIKAKNELCDNIHCRLRWVLMAENIIQERDCKLTAFMAKQNHLEYLLTVLDQINKAPEMYLNAVIEVVRRRHFSKAFLTWASDLACHLISIHSEEVVKRSDFQTDFEDHFLNSLFTGMSDMPPSYATEPPSMFDTGLPPLTIEDIENLKSTVPNLCDIIKIPDVTNVTQMFATKPFGVKYEERGVGDDRCFEDRIVLSSPHDRGLLKPTDSQTSATSSHLMHAHLKDLDRGFESETDTEEFEKVGQSPVDLHFDCKQGDGVSTLKAATADASTLTEDNLVTSKSEIEKLKDILFQTSQVSKQTFDLFRTELKTVKTDIVNEKDNYISQCEIIKNMWEEFQDKANLREREKIQRLTVDHELEMNDIKKLAIAKDDEIRLLKHEKIDMECSYSKRIDEVKNILSETEKQYKHSLQKCDQLQTTIESLKLENERAVSSLREQMSREHQNEIESLRSRFKLMTVASMERSPSDTSLERIERVDMIELVNHESIVSQMKENFSIELKNAVSAAVEEEQKNWSAKLENDLQKLQTKLESEKRVFINDAVRRMLEEKDKQIENLLARESTISRECQKYKQMIQQLADGEDIEENETVQPLLRKVEQLELEKSKLETDLLTERSRKLMISFPNMQQSMGTSVAVCAMPPPEPHRPLTCDASTSTDNGIHRMLTPTQMALIKAYNININTCVVGERALVVWDKNLQNYVLVLDSSSIFVVLADCIPALGLSPPKMATKKDKAVGEVVEKEYCYAKKTENRYHVPQGTRFYRVKLRPLSEDMKVSIPRDIGNQSGPSSLETSTTSTSANEAAIQTHCFSQTGDCNSSHSSGSSQEQPKSDMFSKAMSSSCTQLSTCFTLKDTCPETTKERLLQKSHFMQSSTEVGNLISHKQPVAKENRLNRSCVETSPQVSVLFHSFSQPSSLFEYNVQHSEPIITKQVDKISLDNTSFIDTTACDDEKESEH